MATTSDVFCDICIAQDLSNIAIQWCPECEQALCNDCIKHHSIFKWSKNHETIDVADHKKLPGFVSNVQLTCEEHNEKFQLFCPHHDVACCVQCISTYHTKCQGLLAVVDIVKNAKTSSSLHDVTETLDLIRKSIEVMIKDRARNLKDVQSQFQNVRDVVKETRQKLGKHLDKLENDFLEKVRKTETQVKENTGKVITALKDKDLKLQEYQDNIKTMKEYGTTFQTFFGTREILKYAESEEKHITTCFEDGTLNNDNFQFKLKENITNCLNADSLGSLLLTKTDTDIKPIQSKTKSAQIGPVMSRVKSIDDVKVALRNKFDVSKGKSALSITGCDVTAEGKLVFADCGYNRRVVVHSIDGTYIDEVRIYPNCVFDVSVIEGQKVAVTSERHRLIHIVNISTKAIIKTNNTFNICNGITHFDGKVLTTIYRHGIVSYDMQANKPSTLRKELLGHNSYITCFKNNIYYTNENDNSVTCLSQNYEVIWKFIDETLINGPRSIATDHHGNVLISSVQNNNIVVISADGKRGRIILDETDGLNKVWALCYDKVRQKLVVANYSGDVFVFDYSV